MIAKINWKIWAAKVHRSRSQNLMCQSKRDFHFHANFFIFEHLGLAGQTV